MSRRKINSKPQDPCWYEHWWRNSRIIDVGIKGGSKPKPDAEFWFEHYWQPREQAIWIYELVRRLPNTKIVEEKIPNAEKQLLLAMPPYLKLSAQQKATLVHYVTRSQDSKLIKEESKVLYGSTDRSHLPTWQQKETAKLRDWRHVEAMDEMEPTPPAGHQGEGQKEPQARLERRRVARGYAQRFLPLVLSVWKLMPRGLSKKMRCPPPQVAKPHDLSGAVFSDAEFAAIIKRARRAT